MFSIILHIFILEHYIKQVPPPFNEQRKSNLPQVDPRRTGAVIQICYQVRDELEANLEK